MAQLSSRRSEVGTVRLSLARGKGLRREVKGHRGGGLHYKARLRVEERGEESRQGSL